MNGDKLWTSLRAFSFSFAMKDLDCFRWRPRTSIRTQRDTDSASPLRLLQQRKSLYRRRI